MAVRASYWTEQGKVYTCMRAVLQRARGFVSSLVFVHYVRHNAAFPSLSWATPRHPRRAIFCTWLFRVFRLEQCIVQLDRLVLCPIPSVLCPPDLLLFARTGARYPVRYRVPVYQTRTGTRYQYPLYQTSKTFNQVCIKKGKHGGITR